MLEYFSFFKLEIRLNTFTSERFQFFKTVTGIGLGLMALSSTFMVSRCFADRRGLAMALSVAGGGLGFVVFPMVLSALMSFYGLRGTLLLCSALYLNGLVFGAIYRPKEQRSQKKKNGNFVFIHEC